MDKTISFSKKLALSRGRRELTDLDSIKSLIPGCVSVEKTLVDEDKRGVDYVATLRRGAQLLIDAKTREKGCSKFWKDGPEFAPEIWSVMKSKSGWTLSESTMVDYIFCTFDPSDSEEVFILPFQLYRAAFRKNLKTWKKRYRVAIQHNYDRERNLTWDSQCVFVPADVVLDAILAEMKPILKEEVCTWSDGLPIQECPGWLYC